MSIQSSIDADGALEAADNEIIRIKELVKIGKYTKDVLVGAKLLYKALEDANVFDE